MKRTLDQIPAGIAKPKAADIATLELGQFYVCHGKHITKTYAQPAWMSADDTRLVSRGESSAEGLAVAIKRLDAMEDSVTEQEAQALRDENAELKRRIGELEDLVAGRTVGKPGAKMADVSPSGRGVDGPPSPAPVPTAHTHDNGDFETLYQSIKGRLSREAPGLLKVLGQRPELEVSFQPVVIEADGSRT